MTDTHVWFITGRGRGRGADVTTAARAAGHTGVAIVAPSRTPHTGRAASGGADDLREVR